MVGLKSLKSFNFAMAMGYLLCGGRLASWQPVQAAVCLPLHGEEDNCLTAERPTFCSSKRTTVNHLPTLPLPLIEV